MFWIDLHLMINHFPIILTLVGTGACLIGAARRMRAIWLYGALTLALAGAAAIPAWISGNQAHVPLENSLGVPEGTVEPHEQLSEAAMWILIPMGVLGAFAWWRGGQEDRRGPTPEWVKPALLIAAVSGSAIIGYTALLGGRIMHNEKALSALRADSAGRGETRKPERER